MAASWQLLTCAGFSRQFTKHCLCRYSPNWLYKRQRLFSLLMFQRVSLMAQTSSYHIIKSYSIRCINSTNRSHVIPVKDGKNRTLKTAATDDQEFVSERISIPDEYVKDLESFDDKIKQVKGKTGVLVERSRNDKEKKEHDKSQWNILIGGTRHEVQSAVSLLRSLLNPEEQKQRLVPVQAGKIKEKHFGNIEKPIWAYYRRNFKGQKPPMKTRKRCIRGKGEKQTVSGNPCPMCRLYLGGGYELDYKDIDLLSQFISPHNGEVFEASKTGLCRVQQEKMVKAIETARDYGLLPYSIPGPRSLVQPPRVAQIPRNVRLK